MTPGGFLSREMINLEVETITPIMTYGEMNNYRDMGSTSALVMKAAI